MIIDKLEALIHPEIDRLGFILWGIEIIGGTENNQAMTVRIYIDHEHGISLDDCQQVSETVSTLLDVEVFFSNPYVLEVSSPGTNRRVFNASQAQSLIGFEVKVRLIHANNNNRRKFKGVITQVVDDKVMLETETGPINFSFDNVDKMRVVPKL